MSEYQAVPKVAHVMIDLETLGTVPGCAILSIGAIEFQCAHKYAAGQAPSFYETTYPSGKLFVESKTQEWWDKQDKSIRDEAFSGTKPTKEVLLEFSNYLASLDGEPVVWGNAASFDIKILEAAYKICDIQVPWKYYNELCYRTLKNLFHCVSIEERKTPTHNALHDAMYQAQHADAILNFLATRGVYSGLKNKLRVFS